MTETPLDATVPLDLTVLVDQLAALVALPLQPEHRSGVVDNFARIVAIAQLVTEFPLPDDIEIAPVFEP
ncbi:MAG: DUF4089 domain-containing protein [Verrucomicrobia bacterium]|nr:DUF4089 domain-containing protein [Leptolyngbya sp. ES-bin-22]